nr:MAG TPA: hypothetical protein [Caudoviricetes sp.]
MKANAGYFNQETQKVTTSLPQHKGPGKPCRGPYRLHHTSQKEMKSLYRIFAMPSE